MLDVPLDAWYTWVGLALASAALVGVATALPSSPPPDAAGVADTVDRVAVTEYGATAEHPVRAESVRLGPHRVALRTDAGTTHASFAYGPVTPATTGKLARVLHGAPPTAVYESAEAFERATETARSRDHSWQPADGAVVVRHVTWEETDVTLVGV